MATRDEDLSALKEVYDHEILVNIVDLGLIDSVEFTDEDVIVIDMMLNGMGCTVGPAMV